MLTSCEAEVPPAANDTPEPVELSVGLEDVWFEECATQRGLRFVHRSGHEGERFLFPEIMGGGAALEDLDGDGDLDAYLVQSGTLHDSAEAAAAANVLFVHTGVASGPKIYREARSSGAEDPGYGMGVAVGDVDDDGDPDLYVTNVGSNALLRNESAPDALRFEALAQDAALGSGWSVSAAFFDAENDGDLDLFVVDYIFWSTADELGCRGQREERHDYCSPKSYAAPAPDLLYRNLGAGRFVDVSADVGLRSAFGNGLGVIVSDVDRDGWQDIFVANDGTLNQLWHNQKDGSFRDEALRWGVAVDEHGTAKAGMGVAAADLDDDGDEDLLVVNLALESDSFYRNEGRFFNDRTAVAGLSVASRPYTRFGTGFADFDQDGWLDLFQANGRVARSARPGTDDPYAEPNLVLRGASDVRFAPLTSTDGLAHTLVATSRGAAFGDVDGDGAQDVLVVNRDGPAHLLRNVVSARGNWVALRVLDARGRVAIGAEVRCQSGERTRTRTVRRAYSYASSSSPLVHLGLGPATGVDALEVRWPDGSLELFGSRTAGRVHTLRRGEGDT